MILGIKLAEAIKLVGHTRGTRTAELTRVLNRNGCKCANKLTRIEKDKGYPKRSLLKMNFYDDDNKKIGTGHWVICWDGKVYDPDPPPLGVWPNCKITAYVEIEKDG